VMRLYSRDELIEKLRRIFAQGWHRSVKETTDTRNDGAVGNTLEVLLGISENNLPISNTHEWELKGQRSDTSSLVTLKHMEPSPTTAQIVSTLLLPKYGWPHKEAGRRYPAGEMSFRSTTSATQYSKRGFRIVVDHQQEKIRFVFNADAVNRSDPGVASWLKTVEERVGLGPLNPEPYWDFEDLRHAIGSKMKNCFYAVADRKIVAGREYFLYRQLYQLSGFAFDKFLACVSNGVVLVDFDARTGHNHGTKFRLKQGFWIDIYSSVIQVI